MGNNNNNYTEVPLTEVNALPRAYDVNTLQYKLIYYACNVLWDVLESNPQQATQLARDWGVPEEKVYEVLEELFTYNPDPDNAD